MAKQRFIIEEVRPIHWSVRVRDQESGEVVELPLETGARWPGKPRTDASNESRTTAPSEAPSEPVGEPDGASGVVEPVAEAPDPTPAAEPVAPKKPKRGKGLSRATETEELKDVMSSPALRGQELDEETISEDDAAAFQKMQEMMRRARGRRAGKRGDLGWDETTDAGRSGLIARFGKGAFKILHAGGDTFALFFEWDDGRYDRLACGAAEDLMNLANERARGEPPEPPPSHLSLELARLMCGTAAQKASAVERLEPVLKEVRQNQVPRATPAKPEPEDVPAPDEKLDAALTESLKKALADLDALESKGK